MTNSMTNPPEMKFYWHPQLHCECGWIMRHVTASYDRDAAAAVPRGHGLFECANPEAHPTMRVRVLVRLPSADIIIRQS